MAGLVSRFIALSSLVILLLGNADSPFPQAARVYQNDWQIRKISPFDPNEETVYSDPAISQSGRFVSYVTASDPASGSPTDKVILYDNQTQSIIDDVSVDDKFQIEKASLSPNSRYLVIELRNRDISTISRIRVYDRLLNDFDDRYEQASTVGIRNPISADGRYLLLFDVNITRLRLVDRYTGFENTLATATPGGTFTTATISDNGRWVAYADTSARQSNTIDSRISLFNRIFQSTEIVYTSAGESVIDLSLSANATMLSFTSIHEDDRRTGSYLEIDRGEASPPISVGEVEFAWATGRIITTRESAEGYQVSIQDAGRTSEETLPQSADLPQIAFDQTGEHFVYVASTDEGYGVYLASGTPLQAGNSYAGRVVGDYDYPIGSVTVNLGGQETKTDHHGMYFFEQITSPGEPGFSKEGFSFDVRRETDYRHTAAATPEDVIEEAELDIGMPYSFNRGCSSPFEPCDGPFHGFYTGYCTDLIFDAYLWGVNYNIQSALVKDALANPEHFYRWRDARNAHDMWRYFAYSGQMIWKNDAYAVGDMVFFDWEGNSEIDHVAIVSEVRPSGAPRMLIDATGKINSNPSGLTAELPWLAFHDSTVRGHARWNGLFTANPMTAPQSPILQNSVLISGADIAFYTILQNDERTGNQYVSDSIDLPWEAVGTLTLDEDIDRLYVNSLAADPTGSQAILTSQIFDNGSIPSRGEAEFSLSADLFHRFAIVLRPDVEEDPIRISLIRKSTTGPVSLDRDQP